MSYLVRDLSQDSAEGMQTWGSLLEKRVIAFSVVASACVQESSHGERNNYPSYPCAASRRNPTLTASREQQIKVYQVCEGLGRELVVGS